MRLLILLAVLALLPSALAAPIELSITPTEQTVPVNTWLRFEYTVTNNQQRTDTILLETSGDHPEWKFPAHLAANLQPGERFSAPLDFYTSGPYVGTFHFTMHTRSASDPSIGASAPFTITTLPAFGATGFTASLAGRELALALDVASSTERILTVTFTLRNAAGAAVKEVSTTQTVRGQATIRESVSIVGLPAGRYTVDAAADELEAKAAFTIPELQQADTITETIQSALFDQVTVTVLNTGTVPLRNYPVEGTAPPGDMLTGQAFAGAACSSGPIGQRCTATIPEIPIGGTGKVTYNVAHAVPFQAGAGLLVAAAAAGFGFLHTTRPRISKRALRHRDKHSVILEVRNPHPRRHLEGVVVRDSVGPLAHVVQEDFEPVKPVVSRTDSGTELIWKLGSMKPRETRLLSYKVKPLVQESIHLGRARLHYQDRRGRSGAHHSSEAELAS